MHVIADSCVEYINLIHFSIDTTDVQKVCAMAIDNQHTIIVECEFIPGSDAQGCMVVLVGEVANVTAKLTRNSKVGTVKVASPPSSYLMVLAFDVERDGSIGNLAIPGNIIIVNKENRGLYKIMPQYNLQFCPKMSRDYELQ